MAAAFETRTGRRAEGVWAAPGRVNVIGEHTDYNAGYVLPMAIDRYTYAAAARRDDGVLSVTSAYGGDTVEAPIAALRPDRAAEFPGWARYPLGVAWVLNQAGHAIGGADLLLDSDVPIGAGLSSSAALECATGIALTGLAGIDLPLSELARQAQRAENDFAGVPCGPLDQLASAHGLDGQVLFIDTRDFTITPSAFDLASGGLALLIIDTHASHDHSEGGYAARRAGCERAARQLGLTTLRELTPESVPAALAALDTGTARLVRHVVEENARVLDTVALLDAGRVRETGPLLTMSHVSLRDDYRVSCPEVDVAVATALATGAYGARMTGGGFGGSAIALIDLDAAGKIADAVTSEFAAAGFAEPSFLPAVPARGAHQVL